MDTKKLDLDDIDIQTFDKKRYEQMNLEDLKYFLKFEAKNIDEIAFIKELIKLKK
ncbi:MAG: hypothetical protein LBV69_06725 [Bacteroidales bacterium]|jgi:hypothetical protein|nr:hypothetical protein [Bacteroidales bacterium]